MLKEESESLFVFPVFGITLLTFSFSSTLLIMAFAIAAPPCAQEQRSMQITIAMDKSLSVFFITFSLSAFQPVGIWCIYYITTAKICQYTNILIEYIQQMTPPTFVGGLFFV